MIVGYNGFRFDKDGKATIIDETILELTKVRKILVESDVTKNMKFDQPLDDAGIKYYKSLYQSALTLKKH